MSDTLRTDAKTAHDRAWRIYPQVNVEDGQARTVYIAGYLAGLEEGRKSPENSSGLQTGIHDTQRK